MLSFWEKDIFTDYDTVIIGSGITGLSTAIELKEQAPHTKILVLEKGVLPTGASTKNAGFACVGSLTEIADDLKSMTPEQVVSLVKLRNEGLGILRNRLGDKAIDYEENGSYELCFDGQDYKPKIAEVNALLMPVFNRNVFSISSQNFGFSSAVKTIIESNAEGQIHTGKMMFGLLELARKLGIEIKTGYEAEGISKDNGQLIIEHQTLPLTAKNVCICTNAFTNRFLPKEDIKPGRGQVLITKPIKDLPFKGIYHFSEGYYYFRTIGNRILFGGGRQLDIKGETTESFVLNEVIQADLEKKLREIILPNTPFDIDNRWTGIMAFGDTKTPIIKQVDQGVYAAIRFGGMGVAIGSKAGEVLAKLVLKKS